MLPLSLRTLTSFKWKDGSGCDQTFCLIDRICAKWKKFGSLLGLSPELMHGWEMEDQGNSNQCFSRVMEHWLNQKAKFDYPVTWTGLYVLLVDSGCSVVGEDLKEAITEATEDMLTRQGITLHSQVA